jgi:hypothetical protein
MVWWSADELERIRAKGPSIVQGWISLGRDRRWQLDVYATALNTIEACFADASVSTERIMDVFRARDIDPQDKYLHLLEGGYLLAGDDGGRYFAELPDGVPPGLVIEAPAELSDAALRDRMIDLADEIDSGADADPDRGGDGPRTLTAWVRQVVELSDERGQAVMFAERRALISYELQALFRDPGAGFDPAGVMGACDSMDVSARGLHAAGLMNGRTAGAMAGIAALTKAFVSAESDDVMITRVAGRLLTFIALVPSGSDAASCLSALVGYSLRDGSPDVVELLAGAFRKAGLALLDQALDSTDPSGDEFIDSLHAAALEFEACALLARSVLDAPAEHRPSDAGDTWRKTLDAAEEYAVRIVSSLLDLAKDVTGEVTQALMSQLGGIRREQGAKAARVYARSLVELEYRYPRTALSWLLVAANGEQPERSRQPDA